MKSKFMFILRVVCIIAISIVIYRSIMQPDVVQPLMEIVTKYNILGAPSQLWFMTILSISWIISLLISRLIIVGLEEFDAVPKSVPASRNGGANRFIYWLLPIMYLVIIHLVSYFHANYPIDVYTKVLAGIGLVAWVIGYFIAREKADEIEIQGVRLENLINGLGTHKKSRTSTVSKMREDLLALRSSIRFQRREIEIACSRSDFRSHELASLMEQQKRLDNCARKVGDLERAIALLEEKMMSALVLHFGDGIYMKQGGGWYERDVYFDKKKYLAEFSEDGALIQLTNL
ncbi:hypothetical protein [Listeria booriae]|uniref:hypothetical protein n=1 Tax=Listeria booriae TaxID=1552123 RepID=UPI001E3FC4FC|nr:hypothetical protein [Listeria booriae]MCD2208603.1 hypothetical protein [Listeria booriae]